MNEYKKNNVPKFFILAVRFFFVFSLLMLLLMFRKEKKIQSNIHRDCIANMIKSIHLCTNTAATAAAEMMLLFLRPFLSHFKWLLWYDYLWFPPVDIVYMQGTYYHLRIINSQIFATTESFFSVVDSMPFLDLNKVNELQMNFMQNERKNQSVLMNTSDMRSHV